MAQIQFLAEGGISLFATTIGKIIGNIRDKVGDVRYASIQTWHLLLLVKSERSRWTRHHTENNMPERIFFGKLLIETTWNIKRNQ